MGVQHERLLATRPVAPGILWISPAERIITLMAPQTRSAVQLAGEQAGRKVAVSPDGRMVASGGEDRAVKVPCGEGDYWSERGVSDMYLGEDSFVPWYNGQVST
jgi:hypothetical protein